MNNKEQNLQERVARALGLEVEQVIRTPFVELIEELIEKLETSSRTEERKALYSKYKDICVVSKRTFFRRIEDGMPPDLAARTKPAPTRSYDKK